MFKVSEGALSQSGSWAAMIITKRYKGSTERPKIKKARIKPKMTSATVSKIKRFVVFCLRLVPASQWGITSATKWETIAIGIAKNGFAIFAARLAPISA